jgi:hypothetical protein
VYIVYEYAVCLLATVIGVTMLFTAYLMFLMLKQGGRLVVQTMRKLRAGPLPATRQTNGD